MGVAGTIVLVVVLLLLVAAVVYAASTRASLVRMRDLAVEAGALAEQRRSRLSDLVTHGGSDPGSADHRAVLDAEQRLAGDLSFHAAAVKAYDARMAAVPASWVAALTGLHPLGASADHR